MKKEEEKLDELTLILNSGDNETIIDNLLEYIHKKEAEIEEIKLDLEEMEKSNNHKLENWVHKNILNSYISKDKIMKKIKELKNIIEFEKPTYENYLKYTIDILEELLEESK